MYPVTPSLPFYEGGDLGFYFPICKLGVMTPGFHEMTHEPRTYSWKKEGY